MGALKPVLRNAAEDAVHDKAAVFGTDRQDIAALFMFPAGVLSKYRIRT